MNRHALSSTEPSRGWLGAAFLLAGLFCAPAAFAADGRIPLCMPSPAAPVTISAPGSYYLAENLSFTLSGSVIQIQADHVVLDLNGFTVTTTDPTATVIDINSQVDVRVTNGIISGGQNGIYLYAYTGDFQLDHLTVRDQVAGPFAHGIAVQGSLGQTIQASIEDCTVVNATGIATGITLQYITGAKVSRNHLENCGLNLSGCYGSTVDENVVTSAPNHGISLGTSNNCLVTNNTVSNCTYDGIVLDSSNYCSITWNLSASNTGHGIDMGSGTADNVYAYNRAANNTGGNILDFPGSNVNGGGNVTPP